MLFFIIKGNGLPQDRKQKNLKNVLEIIATQDRQSASPHRHRAPR
jgi:hypothetical protein